MENKQSKHHAETNKNRAGRMSKKGADGFNCRAPYVFSIPRMYDDDYERNDTWYIQLQKIEKRARELKDEMLSITKRHLYLYSKTKRIVEASLERCNKIIYRKSEEDTAS
jgi:hypothetical protein